MITHPVFDMTQEAHWDREDLVVEYLGKQLALGRLNIILGAGVSSTFGLPGWEELIKRLSEASGIPFPPSGYPKYVTLAQIAANIRSTKYQLDAASFLGKTKDALYQGADLSIENLSTSKTFNAIAALVTASARGGVSTVVTLNFDDCLERYLDAVGLVVDSISDPVHWESRADIRILHPHGFLPFEPSSKDSSDIVLDLESFSSLIGKSNSDWYQRVLPIMKTKTSLLIGLGAADQNLFSLLKEADESHPRHHLGIPYTSVWLARTPFAEHVSSFRQHACHALNLVDFDAHLPKVLFDICKHAAKIRKKQLDL